MDKGFLFVWLVGWLVFLKLGEKFLQGLNSSYNLWILQVPSLPLHLLILFHPSLSHILPRTGASCWEGDPPI